MLILSHILARTSAMSWLRFTNL